ncbi:hypothetical protein KSS87_006779 [Heliosperma pusillum]|nr:hypothetical protein KSS87_006779 [Heliosperma pusillum]
MGSMSKIGVCYCPTPPGRSKVGSSTSTSLVVSSSSKGKAALSCKTTLSHIHTCALIACLRAPSAELALGAARAALNTGIQVDVLLNTRDGEVLYIPGVMTPTEILTAYNGGAKIVKLYPVSALGGVEYIAALKKPFSHIPMVASQGISIGQSREYIIRGASAVVLSDAIFEKESVKQGNFDCIAQRAQLAASVANEAVKDRKMVQAQ